MSSIVKAASRLVAISLLISCSPSFAQEGEDSMDSVWNDQAKSGTQSPSQAQTQSITGNAPAEALEESKPSDNKFAPELKASLGSLASFQQSAVFKTSVWPGVGPFKPTDHANDYQDEHENKVRIKAEGDEIKSVELLLSRLEKTNQGLLNLQLSLDFTLEALGMKNPKISDVNTFLDKNKDKVLAKQGGALEPLNTAYGGMSFSFITIGREGEPNQDTLVKISAKNDGPDRLEDSLLASLGQTSSATQHGQIVATATTTIPASKAGNLRTEDMTPPPQKQASNQTPKAIKTSQTNNNKTESKPENKPETKPKNEPDTKVDTSTDALKNELCEVIKSWQRVKKEAVKTKNPAGLASILSGKALAAQTINIKWLTDNKQHYEISNQTARVDKYTVTGQNPKIYSVNAQVKELNKQIEDGTNRVIEEKNEAYDVNYTIEKVGNDYKISAFQLIKKPKTAGR